MTEEALTLALQNEDVTVVGFPGLGLGPWALNKTVFTIGSFTIKWYGLLICLGMILAAAVILYNATEREKFKRDSYIDYFLLAIPLSIVGARTMFVVTSLDQYIQEGKGVWETIKDMVNLRQGGLAVYGGVIAGALAVFLVALKKKEPYLKVMDAAVPGLILAQSIGRWGNFVNGEAYGYPTDLPWRMNVNGLGEFHPTFLYEALLTLTGFLLMEFLLYRFKKFDGVNVSFYMVWYGAGRAFIEGLRSDSLPYTDGTHAFDGSLRISQIIGIVSVVAGVVLFILLLTGYRKKCAEAGGIAVETPSGAAAQAGEATDGGSSEEADEAEEGEETEGTEKEESSVDGPREVPEEKEQ